MVESTSRAAAAVRWASVILRSEKSTRGKGEATCAVTPGRRPRLRVYATDGAVGGKGNTPCSKPENPR